MDKSSAPQPFDLKTATAEQKAIAETVENYFRGHANDDPSYMRKAFLPTAHIESMQNGEFTSWPLETYGARFKGSPAADESSRRRRIDWIDVGGTSACAKITLMHGATTFIDYFVLLKTADGWRIANKAFCGMPTANAASAAG